MQERADLSETKNHVKYQNLEDRCPDRGEVKVEICIILCFGLYVTRVIKITTLIFILIIVISKY